jgi:hypothetical protein
MTAQVTDPVEAPRYCAAHPDVETALSCGRCETPICPRCMVQTPVGGRCRTCANVRKAPMYTLGPALLGRVALAALGGGLAGGLLWGYLLPGLGGFGFFMLFAGLLAGHGMSRLVDRAGKGRRGPVVQGLAVAGLSLAYLSHNVVAYGALIIRGDLWGLLFTAVAAAVAWNQLR